MESNIKKLWLSIPKEERQEAIIGLSDLTKVKPISIAKNWLCESSFWSVPERHEKEVIMYLQNYNKNGKR